VEYRVTGENFDSIYTMWREPGLGLKWPTFFISPPWLQAWWELFGDGSHLYLRAVRQEDGQVIGIAPLMLRNNVAAIVGSPDVCDYADFAVKPGCERPFFKVLLEDLAQHGVDRIDLHSLRPDSIAAGKLLPWLGGEQFKEDISLEIELPAGWDQYLQMLTKKQRHEIRRKLRRLEEAGEIKYRLLDDSPAIEAALELFLDLFNRSRADKSAFMSPRMESFFRAFTGKMARAGLLKLGVLELNHQAVAAVLCFDYNSCIYLYNSGYDPDYACLSVGLLSKVLLIKQSIAMGRKRFDFLKGGESYKYRLGGSEIELTRCRAGIPTCRGR